jgi:hypothetical protein
MSVELRYRDDGDQIHIERQELTREAPGITGRTGQASLPDRFSRERRNGRQRETVDRAADRGRPKANFVDAGTPGKSLRVYSYGVARNRIVQAGHSLGVRVELVDEIDQADVLLTLKNYYRRRRRIISEAEQRRMPIYVLRANTVNQIENFLVEALNLEVAPSDPFESAIAEAEKAIGLIQTGHRSVDLSPASSVIRRYQHQLARQANLVSHSYGKEPNRHVRIFSSPRNESRRARSGARS